MIKDYININKYLFEKYHLAESSYSNVTSSHWRKVGGYVAKYDGDEIFLKGIGFGDYIVRNPVNLLRFLPERILLEKLIKKYDVNGELLDIGKNIAKSQNRLFNYDCVKQILSLNFIKKSISNLNLKEVAFENIAVIGDGYGYMSSLLKKTYKDSKIIVVNLGKTLLFDTVYLEKSFRGINVELLQSISDIENIPKSEAEVFFLEAENYDLLEKINCCFYINIASMQEMNLDVVKRYFELMRHSNVLSPLFYCCNRAEKQLPDGNIIRFSEYGWTKEDDIYVDELCPWYQQYPSSLPPFWKPFDGSTRHRLVRLRSS